jgi:hypothetical protein
MKASDLVSRSISNATYAVAFSIPRSAPFQALDLSYMLICFMDKYIRSGDYTRFNLVSIVYKLGACGTVGVLFFDSRLHTAYRHARNNARASNNTFRRRYHHPISTWPSNCAELKKPNVVAQLMRNVRYMFLKFKNLDLSQIKSRSRLLVRL